jgi:hypothetical protein
MVPNHGVRLATIRSASLRAKGRCCLYEPGARKHGCSTPTDLSVQLGATAQLQNWPFHVFLSVPLEPELVERIGAREGWRAKTSIPFCTSRKRAVCRRYCLRRAAIAGWRLRPVLAPVLISRR